MDEKISNLFNFTLMHHISVTITWKITKL
jgi:hypothetical protein